MAKTRFRAYQLGEEGSSFSYCHANNFTLVEARLTEYSIDQVIAEINSFGNGSLDTLHITSWDKDHCNPSELEVILDIMKPNIIEAPGYKPSTDSGKESINLLENFKNSGGKVIIVRPEYINSLEEGEKLKWHDIIYWPLRIDVIKSNNNSTAKLFRQGHFTVVSFGDLEEESISREIVSRAIITSEVDIMILAHHGADNGFTNDVMLKKINPSVTICTSNYDSQFDHPREEIRQMLNNNNIPLYTTKTGDVIIESGEDISEYTVYNLIGNSTQISSSKTFKAKTY